MNVLKWIVGAAVLVIAIVWVDGRSEMEQIKYVGLAMWLAAVVFFGGQNKEISSLKQRVRILEIDNNNKR